MGILYNLASTSTSVAMIGAVLSFVGVGLLILIFSERMLHGLSKLFFFLGSQVLMARRIFSKKYIDNKEASNNQFYIKQTNITKEEVTLSEQKEWLERILKMKVQVKRSDFEI